MLIPKAEPRITQILQFLKNRRYRDLETLVFESFDTEDTHRSPPHDAPWKAITCPHQYGKPWHCHWFRSSFRAPTNSSYPLYLRIIPNSDSLVFLDQKPLGALNPHHKKLKIEADGKEHTLHIEAYGGHYFPGCHPLEENRVMLTLGRSIKDYPNVFEGGTLAERIEPVYGLYYDALTLFETAGTLDKDSLRRVQIIQGLYEALMDIYFDSAGQTLEEEAAAARTKLLPLMQAVNGSTVPAINLIGHAHIDHAWLWHIGETERKIARTYMNMCALMKEYPEFVFIQSQSAQLELIKNEYPEIFEAVKEAYKKGSWEPNGGMWVEADCNVTGGESLIRQFLVGKQAYRELLGDEQGGPVNDVLWLPDVFGYAAALPQILAKCGIKYFITSKINWNDTTRFPYDSFIWRGIDGTGIATHFISSRMGGYNGRVRPEDLWETWKNIQHKELQSAAVKPIGEGDGGGGTARGDLEIARRLANLEGAPKAAWKKVSQSMEEIFSPGKTWPEWKGELYLELHRGTYTTQGAVKRYNRKLEYALRRAEFFSVLALIEMSVPYPHQRLLANWKLLLTNQFHDIIPGSSIKRVYDETKETYKTIEKDLEDLTNRNLYDMKRYVHEQNESPSHWGLQVYNDLSWDRSDPQFFNVDSFPADFGKGITALKPIEDETSILIPDEQEGRDWVFPVQPYVDLQGQEQYILAPKILPLGYTTLIPTEYQRVTKPFAFRGDNLKTPYYEVRFDQAGRIVSLYDVEMDRELCAPGGFLNSFVSAQDVPLKFDAWDIDADWKRFMVEETKLLSTEISASGPVCFAIRRTYQIGQSTLTQDMRFYAESRRIDFDTLVDWREKHRLLKTIFNTAINTDRIRCEVQYGHIFRNTHQNLPQDRAQFEFCAHKWVSLEDSQGSIALLNDCKYGHHAEGGTVGLTLLRSPLAPDPEADQGLHRFCYALLPYLEAFEESDVIESGYELNVPSLSRPIPLPMGKMQLHTWDYSFFDLEGDGVIVETIKVPEEKKNQDDFDLEDLDLDDLDDMEEELKQGIILRLYECYGAEAKATAIFMTMPPIVGAYEVDMLEENPQPINFSESEITLEFKPFEVKTIWLDFES
ncbi:MAG: glycosyl hydrolase-related protein [Treponema sp.]|nr:glycosyl hydrolase-related protein [Treponema sp.]